MRYVRVSIVLAVAAFIGVACLGILESSPGILGGEWRAVDGAGQPADWLLMLSLEESDASWVTGNGMVLVGSDTVAVTVNGPHEHPNVRLDFILPDRSSLGVFRGEVLYRDHVPGYFSTRGDLTLVRVANPGVAGAASP